MRTLHERHIIQAVPHRKIRLDRSLRKTVPRTYQLTVIAAVDAVSDQRAQLDRDATLSSMVR